MTDAYYGYTTGVNGMDMKGILEHSPNIPKGMIFVFSVAGPARDTEPSSLRAGTISGRLIVLDTDYQTYLVLFHCMGMSILGSRKAVYILSKDGAEITEDKLKQVWCGRRLCPGGALRV